MASATSSLSEAQRLGWIGLGSMGLPMATNLQRHLTHLKAPSLRYYNRTISRGEPIEAAGGVPCSGVGQVVADSDIIFLSLSDDAALHAIIDAIVTSDAAQHLKQKIVVDTSTVHPEASAKAESRLGEKGIKFIAAPVFGASPVAAKGQLLWILAGPDEAIQAIDPFVVGVMGRGIIRLGEDVKKATMMKTAGNFITAGMMEVIAEAHVFAEKVGLGNAAMETLIEQQYGPLALSMSQRLTTGAYMPPPDDRPWSDLNLALKDVGHGIKCAEDAGARLEAGEVALKHLQEAKRYSDEEGRALDSSSMYGVLRRDAGLDFATDLVKERDGSL